MPASQLLNKYLISDLPSAADIQPYLERMDANRWYTNFGPLVHEFEQKLTTLITAADTHPQNGSIHLTTMTSCYHALEVGLKLLGVPKDGKVLIPAVTFPGCALAVQNIGAEVIFADIDPLSWTLTPDIARRVAENTPLAAVMPVALYGLPLPAIAWDEFSRETGIPVIIDAAAAVEKQAILRNGLVAHSLHATKPFGIGEGGLLVSRNPDVINKARVYSNFGMIDRIAHTAGANTKMSEYHAAVGLAQAARWKNVKQRRRGILDLYRKHLKPLANMVTLHPDIDAAVVSLFMLRFNQPIASEQIERSKNEGIALHRVYLPPLYHHPHFSGISVADTRGVIQQGANDIGKKITHMPNSEMIYQHLVGVPFHPFLTEDEIAAAALTIRQLAAA